MVEETLRIMNESDWFMAAAYLNRQPDKITVLESYNKMIKQLFNQDKNVAAMVAMTRAGIQYGLAAAEALVETDPESAWQIRERTRALSYNLASYTWPGWDDPGISIGQDSMALGLDGAKLTLRLTEVLELGALKQSRSHWLLGAHLLAHRNLNEAIKTFDLALKYAEEAKSEADILLNQGYIAIAQRCLHADDMNLETEFLEIKESLHLLEDGEFFAEQLDTAWRVFQNRFSLPDL